MWPNVFLLRLGGHPWAAFEAQPAAGSVWLDGWGGKGTESVGGAVYVFREGCSPRSDA